MKIKVGNTMYDLLSEGDNNKVVKWIDNTAAKLFPLGNQKAQAEFKLLRAANEVNGLVVTGIVVEFSPCYEYDMLVMERLTILNKRSVSLSERKAICAKFLTQLNELHKAGFVHGDIKRPSTFRKGDVWDNVCITPEGIRLIDTGCSKMNATPELVALDLKEANEFVAHFVN